MTKKDYKKLISKDSLPKNYMKIGKKFHSNFMFWRKVNRIKTLTSRVAIIAGIGFSVNYFTPDEVKEDTMEFLKKAKRELIDRPKYKTYDEIFGNQESYIESNYSLQGCNINLKRPNLDSQKPSRKELMEKYQHIN